MAEYRINTELNGIEIYFQQKPESKTIDQLKAEGWRWHNSKRCWYNRRNDTTLSFARRICGESESGELTQILTDLKCIRLKDRLKKEYRSLWKKDYDNYSFDQLTELENQFELEKKKEIYYSIPTEYKSYHNLFYFMWSPDSISLSELESIKKDSEMYLAKKEEIVQSIDKK